MGKFSQHILPHFKLSNLLFFFCRKIFCKQLFSYKIMGSVNVVFVKEEEENKKIKCFSYPDWSDIQRTRIIHIQFSHQEISELKIFFLWFIACILEPLPHGLSRSWITQRIFQEHYLMKKTSLLLDSHVSET